MPTIADARPYVEQTAKELSIVPGVKAVYVWGSYADNRKNPKYNVKDIDLLVHCDFNSGDLLAIDKTPDGPMNTAQEELSDLGFNPEAVAFTKKYLKHSQFNIDQWAISGDDKLMHWGPLPETIDEWMELRKEAESEARRVTGLVRKQLSHASHPKRENWKEAYDGVIERFFQGIPTGWYASDVCPSELISKAIKL